MSFDNSTRNKLLSLVTQARNLLAEEFRQQLQSIYGIQPDGSFLDLSKQTHLDGQTLQTATLLRDRISQLASNGSGTLAVDRVLREQAFTVFNRLVALRMAETRGLIQPSVSEGYQSKGFRVFESLGSTAFGPESYHRYRLYLDCLCDELTPELGFLFDRSMPQGLLFPRETALLELLGKLNEDELRFLWDLDETIGWTYQYFNSIDERKAMREQSSVPRNSRELAIRNQFFTPRYVVEFLVDNTLGRTWISMCGQESQLVQECKKMLPTQDFHTIACKDPRELKILDPACGSGHFLLYCFDLLLTIYQEAWQNNVGKIRKEYATLEEWLLQAPKSIVENNLWGVDIDSRAAQIASLALWFRAQKAYQLMGIPLSQRPVILHSGIAVAEPLQLEESLLAEFAAQVQPPILGQLLRQVVEKMELAGEAGTLLRIESEIRKSIQTAEKQWALEHQKVDMDLFGHQEPTQTTIDFKGTTKDFWSGAEERLWEALENWVENGSGYRRRLLAEDALRGFAFMDVCRQRYDVVLMNPPFGESSKPSKAYLQSVYPRTKNDLYAAFVERGLELLVPHGLLGAITSRTGFFLTTFKKWREEILLKENRVVALADLGAGVLDTAMVETAAYVIEKGAEYDSRV